MRDVGEPGSWVENLPLLKLLRPYWHYAWSRKIPAEARVRGVEFVPMVWGCWGVDGTRDAVQADITPEVQSGRVKRLLGFNEPDAPRQANMGVEKSVECWPALQETGLLLGAPVMANNSGEWLPRWREAVASQKLRVDYTTVHWYSSPNVRAFKSKMRQIFLENGRKPLLITEFAPADWDASSPQENRFSMASVLAFMKDVLPWLESSRFVAGYAWFPFRTTSAAGACSALFDENGNPTALARYYASVTRRNPLGNRRIALP
jgi:Glycosyl hydrolase catalytic core